MTTLPAPGFWLGTSTQHQGHLHFTHPQITDAWTRQAEQPEELKPSPTNFISTARCHREAVEGVCRPPSHPADHSPIQESTRDDFPLLA